LAFLALVAMVAAWIVVADACSRRFRLHRTAKMI
jgi:hypothetical protein